jgi:ABC-type spermidine/putrescine transport system permease subunit II
MSVFLVVHWWVWLVVFLLGAVVGLAAANLLSARKPRWGRFRRTFAAAATVPGLILVGAVVGAWLAAKDSSADNWGYLIAATLLQVGFVAALVSLAGGLAGAAASERLLSE